MAGGGPLTSGAAGQTGRAPLGAARVALAGFTLLALAVVGLEVARSDVTTTLEPRARRPAAVVTDGRRILEVETRTGRVASTVIALPTTADERIVAVAPRPGALRGLPMVVLSRTADEPSLWWVDEAGRRREFPEQLGRPLVQTGPAAVDPVPVWSPDGGVFAWLEGDAAAPTLRAVVWSADGPRADDERHTRSTLGQGLHAGARLEAWRWEKNGQAPLGRLLVSDDQPGLYELDVRRLAGGVRPLNGRPRRLPGALVDRADAGGGHPGAMWPRYQLVLPLERSGRPQLRWTAVDGSSGTLPLPEGLRGSRRRWWLDAFGPLVLIGDGTRAWALQPDGSTVALPGTVVHGAALDRDSGGNQAIVPDSPSRRLR